MSEQPSIIVRLLKVSNALPRVKKLGHNEHTGKSYMRLNEILEILEPLMEAQGLTLSQMVVYEREDAGSEHFRQFFASVAFDNTTGDRFVIGRMPMPEVDASNAQRVGGVITYLRRYTLVPFFGIMDGDDDDGRTATGTNHKQQSHPVHRADAPTDADRIKGIKREFARVAAAGWGSPLDTEQRTNLVRDVAGRLQVDGSSTLKAWHDALIELQRICAQNGLHEFMA